MIEPADLIIKFIDIAIGDEMVIYGLVRLTEGATEVSCSAFSDAMIVRL